MPLHLVGENIDKARSFYLAETGKIVQLMRGVYVDKDDDIDATVFRHAVRIAKYLHPRAYLSASSAILLGPTADGRLFLSAKRNQRTRIRALEIIQNEAPKHPSLSSAVINDGLGEFRTDVSSIRQRFLEAFRLRSEHASSIDDTTRETIAARLVEEYGSASAAAEAAWALARENGWYKEGEAAERFLLKRPTHALHQNLAAIDLVVAWHGSPVGNLSHDGFEWRWSPRDSLGAQLIRQPTPGKLPPFIVSLLPEGWLEAVLKDRDERSLLRSGKRYMSNITIVEDESELARLPSDILLTKLKTFTADGRFAGRYVGPRRGDLEQSFEQNLARIYERGDTPRLSGIQIKAPMYLDTTGQLLASAGQPFTHILKPAGTSGFEHLPVVEWLALTIGTCAGLTAPAIALVEMPDDMPPALLVERFDIRHGLKDKRQLALEDFCSVLGLPSAAKYDATLERVVRAARPLSTSPDEDVLAILKRGLFAWLIADGDMHLKNLALLKIMEAGENAFTTVRIAPLYDSVTTRVFPQLAGDRMALKLNGRDDNLRRADFRQLATLAAVRTADADTAMDELISGVGKALDSIALPKLAKPASLEIVEKMLATCRERISSFS